MNIILILILCLVSSCGSFKPLALYDVSFKFKRCRASCFDLNTTRNVVLNKCFSEETIREFYDGSQLSFPLNRCEGVAGFTLSDWAVNILPVMRRQSRSDSDSKKVTNISKVLHHLTD